MPVAEALRFYFFIYLEVGICVLELHPGNMTKVGLTGGIGSGKTTVAKIFEMLGVPVYYADDAAKRIMNEDEELKKAIEDQFGAAVYKDGELDRDYLASKVFRQPQQLELLNALVHPATIRDAVSWMEQQKTAYTIKEAALIFESAAAEQLDYIIGVYAPTELRIRRTMERNNVTREEVLRRMDNQLDEKIKMKLCDFVLYNDEQQLLIPQVIQLHQKLLAISEKK
jgi:dephospho-CoA kinase